MPARFRVLLTDRALPDCEVERRILSAIDAEIVEAPTDDEATLVALAGDCDAIATCWARVTARVIRAAGRCRLIARYGVGLDNICVETATESGIPVTCVPDYCVAEVAEHTLALLLSLVRRTTLFDARAKRGDFERRVDPPMRRLEGQTLGLVGFGRIGQSVFRRAEAFGLNVVATSASGDDHGENCRMILLNDLLRQSDVVSLHCPLQDDTRRLIGASQLSRMKSTAFLINTARGGLVDRDALWTAICNRRLAGAALDVFDPEPPDLSHPLFSDERVIVSPHAAFLSADSLRELRTRTARQIADVLQRRRPEHLVNPEVWPHSRQSAPDVE
ncbi:MAG: C-terminal binding protein [Planctomycetaceae bacterium]